MVDSHVSVIAIDGEHCLVVMREYNQIVEIVRTFRHMFVKFLRNWMMKPFSIMCEHVIIVVTVEDRIAQP